MKKISVLVILLIISLCICLCACKNSAPVEDHDITIDEMSFTLPEGDWFVSDDNNQFEGKNCTITIKQADDYSLEDEDYSFYHSDDLLRFEPQCDFTYIDGYLTEVVQSDEYWVAMIDKNNGYYCIVVDDIDNEKGAKKDFFTTLYSIRFDRPGNHDAVGLSWEEYVIRGKDNMPDDYEDNGSIQGIVMAVDNASESEGSPIYIDIGEAYPSQNRVTGIIWEEYQSDFNLEKLYDLEGSEVILRGNMFMRDGVLNVRIENSNQIILIKDLLEL